MTGTAQRPVLIVAVTRALHREWLRSASCGHCCMYAYSNHMKFPSNQKKRAVRSLFYSNKPKPVLGYLPTFKSSLTVKFEFTTLPSQTTTAQTCMNAGGLFTTLFACLRL